MKSIKDSMNEALAKQEQQSTTQREPARVQEAMVTSREPKEVRHHIAESSDEGVSPEILRKLNKKVYYKKMMDVFMDSRVYWDEVVPTLDCRCLRDAIPTNRLFDAYLEDCKVVVDQRPPYDWDFDDELGNGLYIDFVALWKADGVDILNSGYRYKKR